MKEGSIITLISHELDGAWQFMGNEPIIEYEKVAMIVALDEIAKHDKSVLEMADLPKGYQAARLGKNDKWEIVKIDYDDSEIEEMEYYCSECDKFHREIPMSYGAKSPTTYFNLTDDHQKQALLTQDICVINDKRFFIKGRVKIAVEEKPEPFSWNVWVEIDKLDFENQEEHWSDENRFLQTPYKGVLDTPLGCYPNTLGLKVKVQTQKIGLIPEIIICETDHPLFFEQKSGIDMSRVIMFAKKVLYGHK